MKIKILHIIDVYLPETMIWLEKLLLLSNDLYEHHIHTDYLIGKVNSNFTLADPSKKAVAYPITIFDKISNKIKRIFSPNEVLNYIRLHQIDLLHVHFGHLALDYFDTIKNLKIPKVISFYGFDYERLPHLNPKIKSKYKALGELGCFFIVEGNYSRNVLHSYGIAKERIKIVHMLYAHQYDYAHKSLSRPIRFVQVATYTEKKGQDIFLEAIQTVSEPNFIVDFYGEIANQEYYSKLQNLARKSKHVQVRFHSKISFEQYKLILQQSDIAVNLSRRSKDYDTEGGCPVFVKDALWFGKPVFSTDHCDIPEIVVHGLNGWIAKENSVESASLALSQILKLSQNEYRRYATNALMSVDCNAKGQITLSDIIACYNSMLR
jgi:colanic acid/amylovoran biosynthesis glycosyltransferase